MRLSALKKSLKTLRWKNFQKQVRSAIYTPLSCKTRHGN